MKVNIFLLLLFHIHPARAAWLFQLREVQLSGPARSHTWEQSTLIWEQYWTSSHTNALNSPLPFSLFFTATTKCVQGYSQTEHKHTGRLLVIVYQLLTNHSGDGWHTVRAPGSPYEVWAIVAWCYVSNESSLMEFIIYHFLCKWSIACMTAIVLKEIMLQLWWFVGARSSRLYLDLCEGLLINTNVLKDDITGSGDWQNSKLTVYAGRKNVQNPYLRQCSGNQIQDFWSAVITTRIHCCTPEISVVGGFCLNCDPTVYFNNMLKSLLIFIRWC